MVRLSPPAYNRRTSCSIKKQKTLPNGSVIYCRDLDSPLNLVGAEASGTSVHMAGSSVNDSLNALDVGLPHTVGTSVRVGDSDTESHALVAKLTLSHPLHLLAVLK